MVSSVEIAKPKSNCEADWLKDAGIVGDIRDLWKSKSALDATLNSIGVVADLVDAAVNPIKTGVSWAVNWIISHIAPLPDMLQQFTGDPEKVEAAALTWERIGDQWTQAAAELEAAVAAGLDAQVCRTLSAYKVQIGSVIETFRSLGDACKIVATCLNILSAMVKIVYDLTREAIGDLIGTFVQSVAEAVGTVGLAVPAIIAQISATVSKWVTRITTKGKQVLNGFQEALKSFTKLDGVLEKLGGALKKLFSHVGDVPDKVHDAWKAGKHKVDDLADGVEDAWKAGKHKVDDLADGVEDAWKAGKHKVDDLADGVEDAWKSGKRKIGDFVDDPKAALKAGADKIGDLAEDAWKAGKHKVDDFTDGVKDAWATGKRGVGEFIDDPRAAMKAGGEKAHEFYSSTVRKPIDYMGKPSEYAEEVGKQWGEKATRFIYRGQSAERLEKLDEFFARGDRAIPFKKARDALSDVNDYKELWKKTTEVYGQSGLPSQNKED
ncbi:hypothetical protein [Schaalia sp. HMT-172]|uniref:hypothetical protein n=1 Tax=Schaalia sp. HMT-172 TaxID=3059028 RepID=UPI0025DAB00E|nr:hypothetical protein [Schaalia sp. HMT-172]WLD78354.1 hypothetical protein QU663_01625 [Schaalia sp. HMT-172]